MVLAGSSHAYVQVNADSKQTILHLRQLHEHV